MNNLIDIVANKLDVKIGEKFCIRHYRGHLLEDWDTQATLVFMFTEDKGIVSVNTNNQMYQNNAYLADLILGRYTIEPYVKGCETPKHDKELKNIYEELEEIREELTNFTNPQWLCNKEIFFNDDTAKLRYEELENNIEKIRDSVCDTMTLPIFHNFNKSEE